MVRTTTTSALRAAPRSSRTFIALSLAGGRAPHGRFGATPSCARPPPRAPCEWPRAGLVREVSLPLERKVQAHRMRTATLEMDRFTRETRETLMQGIKEN